MNKTGEKVKKSNSEKIQAMVFISVFTALMVVLSQIAIPFPTHVPMTLQTFAIALAGYFLGAKDAAICMVVYIMLGIAGVPVFANFSSGIGTITSYTGGFIIGFIPMAFLCGLGVTLKTKGVARRVVAIILGLAGLFCTHALGVIHFSRLMDMSIKASIVAVSLPYLIKDIISVVVAYLISEEIIKRVAKLGYFKNAGV